MAKVRLINPAWRTAPAPRKRENMARQQEVVERLNDLIETLRNKNPAPSPIEPLLGKLEETLHELPDKIAGKVAGRLPKPSRIPQTNPNAAISRRIDRLADLRDERDSVLSAVGDALDALDEGDSDAAEDILDEILENYDIEEMDDEEGNEDDDQD